MKGEKTALLLIIMRFSSVSTCQQVFVPTKRAANKALGLFQVYIYGSKRLISPKKNSLKYVTDVKFHAK